MLVQCMSAAGNVLIKGTRQLSKIKIKERTSKPKRALREQMNCPSNLKWKQTYLEWLYVWLTMYVVYRIQSACHLGGNDASTTT